MSAGDETPRAAYESLERVLVVGLSKMPPLMRELVKRRVLEGRDIEFAVRMGAMPYLACSLVTGTTERLELFRVDFGADGARLN